MNAFFGIPAHAEAEAAAPADACRGGAPPKPRRRSEHAEAARGGRGASARRRAQRRTAGQAGAVFFGPENESIERGAPFAGLGQGLAVRRDADRRWLVAYWFYIVNPEHADGAGADPAGALPLPAQQVVLRRDLRLPLRAAGEVARHLPVEGRRRRHHRRLPERRRDGDRALVHPARRAGAVGLSLPLRLRHGARARVPDALARPREGGDDEQPAVARHLPAADRRGGAARLPARRGRAGAAQRQAAGAVHHDGDLPAVALRARGVRPVEHRLPVRRGAAAGSAGSPTRWASTASRCCS